MNHQIFKRLLYMRQTDIIELDRNFLPKKKMECELIICYGCFAILGAGTYILSFFAGYHLKDSEDHNTTFYDRG